MDEDSSAKFIGSLTKFLQSLCNGYVEFSRGVELVGHIYLNIDTGEKVDYVLHERVSKNDENSVSFTSNSFHAQPQDKKKTKEASRPDPKGSNRKVNSDDDDDIVIVDHSHSQGAVGSTNTGSVLARGMKRVGSPGFDHRHAQRPRPSPHNTSSHSYTSVNRQQSGRPSATVTSQGASHNENLNISDVKLEQISRDELLSIATHVGEGSGPPHSQTSSSSSVSRSQAQHSGMPGSTIRVGGTGDAAMWVKQEVPDDGDADNNTGWSQERDDSNSNSGSNLYPVMLHQNPAFPGSSVPGFSGHGGPSGANPFPMPGTSQDMSGLDPSVPFWRVPADVPLPPFSPDLLPMLRSLEQVDHSTRLRMAGIAATFYFSEYHDYLLDPSAYRLIGRRMMDAFPALMAAGPHPWTDFVKAVSYKVRRKRFRSRHGQLDNMAATDSRRRSSSSEYGCLSAGQQGSFQVLSAEELTESMDQWQ